MRVIVCGGRNYTDRNKVYAVLNTLYTSSSEPLTIIQGGAQGADRLALDWALLNNITHIEYPADWNSYGKRAGYIRNKQMLNEGKADLVLAFPGGPGTNMVINLAEKANVKVIKIT